MNWKTGLFRFWCFLSLIWAAITLLAGVTEAVRIIGLPTADAFFGCDVVPRPANCGPIQTASTAYFLGWWASFVLKYLLIAASVPAILGALGLGASWVISGFRTQAPK